MGVNNINNECLYDFDTGNPFRSSDLGVMSPARCPCAMPVEWNGIAAFIASSLTITTCRYRSHTVLLMRKKITIRLSDRYVSSVK